MDWGGKAQTSIGSIKMDAKQGQGYIVMNQASTPYTCWRYFIQERTGKATAQYPNGIVPLDNITVCGKDFVQLPTAYGKDTKRDIIVSVYGVTSPKGGATTETPVILNKTIGNYSGIEKAITNKDYKIRCGAACDGMYQGKSYAYQFRIHEEITAAQPSGTGVGYMDMNSPFQEMIANVGIPFYGYYSPTQAQAYLTSIAFSGTMADYKAANLDVSGKLYVSDLEQGIHVHDSYGNIIIQDDVTNPGGIYYMIPKDFGIWEKYRTYLAAGIQNYDYDGNNCGNVALGLFTQQMNTRINAQVPSTPQLAGWTNLQCSGQGWSLSESEYAQEPSDCQQGVLETVILGDIGPWEILELLEPCVTGGSTDHHEYWEQYAQVNLVSATGGSGTTPTWTFHNVGRPPVLGEKINIPAGLYNLEIATKKGEYRRLVVQAKQPYTATVQMKDLVSPVIFPVPIVNNDFKINIETPFDVTFTYELWDKNGVKIHSQIITVAKTLTDAVTIPIAVRGTIPTGNLINRFIYSDGSIRTINTMK